MHQKCYSMFNYILVELGENEFSWDDLSEWWQDHKCYICENRFPLCKYSIDEYCPKDVLPDNCPHNQNNKCTDADSTCTKTRNHWCENFKESNEVLQ